MTTLRRKSGAIFTFCFCAFRKLEASTFVPEWSADNGVLTSCAVAATAFTYASAFVCKCRACSRSRFRCFRDSTAILDASCKSDKTNSEKGSETGSEEGSEKECDANSEIDSETGSESENMNRPSVGCRYNITMKGHTLAIFPVAFALVFRTGMSYNR